MNTDTKPSGITCPEGCPACAELMPLPHYNKTDIERIEVLAEMYRTGSRFGKYNFSALGLLAFEQAVLAKKDESWMKEIQELRQYALGIEKLLTPEDMISIDGQERLGHILYSIRNGVESLQAKLAMQAEKFDVITNLPIKWYVSEREARFVFANFEDRDAFVCLMIGVDTLSATQADVDTFMASKKAEWEKGVLEKLYPQINFYDNVGEVQVLVAKMIKERGEV